MHLQKLVPAFTALLFFSCTSSNDDALADKVQQLQSQVDSLAQLKNDLYKPGLGEFMSTLQLHHGKLWFAGKNENWELAQFEADELQETLDDIRKFETDRPETAQAGMLQSPIDDINHAIAAKNLHDFENAFQTLTSTCNNCHLVTHFSFNVIKIPETPPVTNQEFSR